MIQDIFLGILIPLLNGIFAPLNHLAEQMKKVSEGNLDVAIEGKTKDEIGELGSVFNYMLAELKSNIAILMEKNKRERLQYICIAVRDGTGLHYRNVR